MPLRSARIEPRTSLIYMLGMHEQRARSFILNTCPAQDALATAERETVRLKSLEGSDSTALALLSNDVNASVALCRDLLSSHCAAAAFVLSVADEAAASIASQLDRVLFCCAPAPLAAEAANASLLQLQRCVNDSERLRSQDGAIMSATVADAMKSCRHA